jgi:rhodanese-related sulfurtransferase
LVRLSPQEAQRASTVRAVVVDIRPAAQRAAEGELPGALVVERNVLEWRFDPASDARLDVADHDLAVIVLCQEGLHLEPRRRRAAGARGVAGH